MDQIQEHINLQLEQILKDLDLLDEYGCVVTLDRGQLRHISRFFYNLGQLEKGA